MGADLIGYMCIGPKKISDRRCDKAATHAWEIVQKFKSWYDNSEAVEPPSHLCNLGIEDPIYIDLYVGMTPNEVEKLVDEIISFWNAEDSRDCAARSITKNKKVVFCGEMSWGDEPSGYGYQMLKHMFVLDIDSILGIV